MTGWVDAFMNTQGDRFKGASYLLPEVVALLLTGSALERAVSSAQGEIKVQGLLGQHARIDQQVMTLRLDEFLSRLNHYIRVRIPAYKAYRQMSSEVLEGTRKRLRLEELKPRVLSTFVRNKLINDVYLPTSSATT